MNAKTGVERARVGQLGREQACRRSSIDAQDTARASRTAALFLLSCYRTLAMLLRRGNRITCSSPSQCPPSEYRNGKSRADPAKPPSSSGRASTWQRTHHSTALFPDPFAMIADSTTARHHPPCPRLPISSNNARTLPAGGASTSRYLPTLPFTASHTCASRKRRPSSESGRDHVRGEAADCQAGRPGSLGSWVMSCDAALSFASLHVRICLEPAKCRVETTMGTIGR